MCNDYGAMAPRRQAPGYGRSSPPPERPGSGAKSAHRSEQRLSLFNWRHDADDAEKLHAFTLYPSRHASGPGLYGRSLSGWLYPYAYGWP